VLRMRYEIGGETTRDGTAGSEELRPNP
jgi:hypothetical protein